MTGPNAYGREGTFPDPDLQLIKDFNMNKKSGTDPDVFLRVHMDIPLDLPADTITELEAALKARDGEKVLQLLGTEISGASNSGAATLRAALGV